MMVAHFHYSRGRLMLLAVTVAVAAMLCGVVHAGKFIENSQAVMMTEENGYMSGRSTDISGDWALVVQPVHAQSTGRVIPYYFNQWNWTSRAEMRPAQLALGDDLGTGVAIHEAVTILGAPGHDANGVSDSGAAFVFILPEGTQEWVEEATLVPSQQGEQWGCGSSVAVRGDFALVGCPYEDNGGMVVLFQRGTLDWLFPDTPREEWEAQNIVSMRVGVGAWVAVIDVLSVTHEADLGGGDHTARLKPGCWRLVWFLCGASNLLRPWRCSL